MVADSSLSKVKEISIYPYCLILISPYIASNPVNYNRYYVTNEWKLTTSLQVATSAKVYSHPLIYKYRNLLGHIRYLFGKYQQFICREYLKLIYLTLKALPLPSFAGSFFVGGSPQTTQTHSLLYWYPNYLHNIYHKNIWTDNLLWTSWYRVYHEPIYRDSSMLC